MANVQGTLEIIVQPASPDENANPPDTVSDAVLNDGPPKANSFFTFVREHGGRALRYTVPILIYAVVVAAPALSVFVVVTREVVLPAALGNKTLASMSAANGHKYLESHSSLHMYYCFLFFNVLVLSFIEGHPTTKLYSVIISVVNVVNASLHTVTYHCTLYFSWNYEIMDACITIIFLVIQIPLNFGIVHIVLQKNAAGFLWWHMPLCAFCVIMECANMYVTKKMTSYLQSYLFQWTAPFIFSLTAMFTRRAAEWSVMPLSAAYRLCSISMCVCNLFARLAQSAAINNAEQFVMLEVYFTILNIFLKVTLYSRHAISSFAMSGKCKVRGVPRSERAQGITTGSNVTESIWDTACFIILLLSRFILLPSSITTTNLALVFCVCIALQMISFASTFLLISYVEGIPIDDFSISTAFGDFRRRWIYHWVGTMWALTYLNHVILNVWDPSIRILVPWK